jgi:hypothetical protein
VTSNAAPREHLRLALARRRVELLQLLLTDDHIEAAFLVQLAGVQTALHALAEVADEELGGARRRWESVWGTFPEFPGNSGFLRLATPNMADTYIFRLPMRGGAFRRKIPRAPRGFMGGGML